MNNDLPTPVPAMATLSVLLGNPPFVIVSKYLRLKGILVSLV